MRSLEKYPSKYFALLWLIALALFYNSEHLYSQKEEKNFYFGVDNSRDRSETNEFFNDEAMKLLGIDFIVYHYRGSKGTQEEEAQKMKNLGEKFKEHNLKVIVNVESGNWSFELIDKDGHDWVKHPDGVHLFTFPPEVLKSLNQSDAVWGIQYDELEHSQIFRNKSLALKAPGVERPALVETTGMTFEEADKAVYTATKKLVDESKSLGTRYVIGEHVWPALFHNFARAGLTPVYKQMKEGWSNVWAAIAMGASMQYNQELWTCIDLWFHDVYPGHSAKELAANLRFAYLAGVDKAYMESLGKHTFSVDKDGEIYLKQTGRVLRDFSQNYLQTHPRPYTFRDYQPEIAIIRFDDTTWGQGDGVYSVWYNDGIPQRLYWNDWLFGAYNLRSTPVSTEWIKAWHTITHGQVKKESLSWASHEVYLDTPHRSFAPANAPIVFDNMVRKPLLESLKLAFLCGLDISTATLNDIISLVKEKGLTVVTSKRFAPEQFASKYSSGTREFIDGKGRWIITDDMAGEEVKDLVK